MFSLVSHINFCVDNSFSLLIVLLLVYINKNDKKWNENIRLIVWDS